MVCAVNIYRCEHDFGHDDSIRCVGIVRGKNFGVQDAYWCGTHKTYIAVRAKIELDPNKKWCFIEKRRIEFDPGRDEEGNMLDEVISELGDEEEERGEDV